MGTQVWVRVFTGPPTDAEMVRGVLEGSGIDAVIQRLGGGAYGLDPGPLGETIVNVKTEDLAEAREILGEVEVQAEPENEPTFEETTSSAVRSTGNWLVRAAAVVTIAVLLLELRGVLRGAFL